MTVAGRSRNAACFCGSGRKLKHCCARQLTTVRTWKHATKNCRWRFWRPHNSHGRYGSELAEHLCTGERVWIARGTIDGTTWLIDDDPITLLAVLDHLPPAHYHWAIEQTMTALDDAAPDEDEPEDPDREIPSEIRQLMLEVLALAHASDALDARLKETLRPGTPNGLTLHDRAIMQIAC
jgi:SEC-C motif